MYVCLFHLASPSPAIRALASELLATFAYSWWNGETKPTGSLSLPPAAAAEAPPEAHLKAANETSELLADTPSSKLWTVPILKEAVALHSLLPTATLKVVDGAYSKGSSCITLSPAHCNTKSCGRCLF